MQTTKYEPITFQVNGSLAVGDPCYHHGGFGDVLTLPNAQGTWTAEVETSDQGDWGIRVAKLTARRDGRGPAVKVTSRILGVDSGRMSIMPAETAEDLALFEPSRFYADGGGCVSSTGFGDGAYAAVVELDEQGPCEITMTFIEDDE